MAGEDCGGARLLVLRTCSEGEVGCGRRGGKYGTAVIEGWRTRRYVPW